MYLQRDEAEQAEKVSPLKQALKASMTDKFGGKVFYSSKSNSNFFFQDRTRLTSKTTKHAFNVGVCLLPLLLHAEAAAAAARLQFRF